MTKKLSRKDFRQRLEKMISTLREQIVSGGYKTGDYLPSENDLEKLFQLSNPSIRKGLDVLVQEGLIEKIPRVGNKVILPEEEQKTVVRFGCYQSMAADPELNELLDLFHEQHPQIQVEVVSMPTSDYYHSLKEYFEMNMLDACTLNNINYQELEEEQATGLLQELEVQESVYPFLMKPFMRGEKTLVRPLFFSPLVLCYNRQHFLDIDLPEPNSSWSWDDLYAAAEKLSIKHERFGFYFYMFNNHRWPLFLLQSGVVFEPDPAGNYNLSETPLVKSMDIFKKLLDSPEVYPAMLSASNAGAEELLKNGKVSMILTTYDSINRQLRNSGVPFEVAPVPSFQNFHTLLVTIGLAVNRNSPVKKAAEQLVHFFTSYEAQMKIRRQTLSIPADRKAAEWQGEERIYRPSRYNMYREIVPTFRTIEDLSLTVREMEAVQEVIKLYCSSLLDKATFIHRIETLLTTMRQAESTRM